MQYCAAPKNAEGTAVVAVTLPLAVVSLFDPRNPPPDSFGCDEAVQVGWIKTSQTQTLNWTPPGETTPVQVSVPVFEAPPPPAAPTAAQLLTAAQQAIQATMDALAQTRGYDSMASLCSYASSVAGLTGDALKFQQEGNAGYAYRSKVWSLAVAQSTSAYSHGAMTLAEAQQTAIAAMPVLTWPDGVTVSPSHPTQVAPINSSTTHGGAS